MDVNAVRICNKTELEISDAGKIMDTVHWIHPSRIMNVNVFLLILDGLFIVEEDGIEYHLKKNDVFFLKNGVFHTSKKYSQDGTSWYYVHFYDNICSECSGKNCSLHASNRPVSDSWHIALPKKINIPDFDKENFVIAMQDIIVNYTSKSSLTQTSLALKLKDMFIRLVELDNANKEKANSDIVYLITNLIKSSVFSNITSREIADSLGYSYDYLSRTFSKATGMTISQYKTYSKIKKAIELFKIENYNVTEVANHLRFDNLFYFSRVFKQVTGISPNQYRKNVYKQTRKDIVE